MKRENKNSKNVRPNVGERVPAMGFDVWKEVRREKPSRIFRRIVRPPFEILVFILLQGQRKTFLYLTSR